MPGFAPNAGRLAETGVSAGSAARRMVQRNAVLPKCEGFCGGMN